MKSDSLHGRVLGNMVESAGLHGGIGYKVECRITWWECWVTWWGVLSYMVGELGYMVDSLVICWGCWVT